MQIEDQLREGLAVIQYVAVVINACVIDQYLYFYVVRVRVII